MYDDFYCEPSEFEAQIEEFKQGLMGSVRREFIDEMAGLREENRKLQDVAKRLKDIKREHKEAVEKIEHERRELERAVRNERLSKLFEDKKVKMYKTSVKVYQQPKCNDCDDNRKIHYLNPQGVKTTANCLCAKSRTIIVPIEAVLYSFRYSDNLYAYYRYAVSGRGEESFEMDSTYCKTVYSGEDFEEIDRYHTFFKTEEECQEYCNYLNDKEKKL